ncbi:MAG TPA: glycosyltransferase family 2 protein [Verrucomicrobiae bacterium]|nr:glycosyltransferase family 2 protein [Verrucomicrobiae bacterium]
MNAYPFVSILVPVFNEERYIAQSLAAVLDQDYPRDRIEIIVADGRSTDRTWKIVQSVQERHGNVHLIDNPERIVSTGLNRALAAARGEIIVRLDGHCEYPKDYVKKVVELREQTGADDAGGVLVPLGNCTYASQAVAAAYYSPVGIGGALRGHAASDRVCEVDTVHGGCWERNRLIDLGGFDESMVRNQDDELSFRLRKDGGRIVRSSAIRVKYWVRDSYRRLFMQFVQYGYWKVRVLRKHPRQSSLRHLVPSMFVLTLVVSAVLAPISRIALWLLGIVAGGYALAMCLAGLREAMRTELRLWPGITLAIPIMHFGYGLGFLLGTMRWLVGRLPTDPIFKQNTR